MISGYSREMCSLPGLSHSSPYVASPQLDLVCSMRSSSHLLVG